MGCRPNLKRRGRREKETKDGDRIKSKERERRGWEKGRGKIRGIGRWDRDHIGIGGGEDRKHRKGKDMKKRALKDKKDRKEEDGVGST